MEVCILVRDVSGIKNIVDVYENVKKAMTVRDSLNKLADEYNKLVDGKMLHEREAVKSEVLAILDKLSNAGDEGIYRPPGCDWITYHAITRFLK